ncbi:hypothetical protein CYMTET_55712 [Cymbomonas tetramitiformis]|uniref:Proteasome assembly chaperone 3 n=1 Tax=Cymbomonas tetramitiformis TaxID=36881 RepID=A0AAE0BDN0_9CHLO|nr:hypothetical protein CYMTET_55712 [Cymbomonas tetramitiformis]
MASNSFPVITKQAAGNVEGIPTDLIMYGYDNQIMIVVTQIRKFGTILHARQDVAYDGTTTYSVNTLMGKRDEPLLESCTRRLVEVMGTQGCKRPLILTLGLKSHTPTTLKGVMDLIVENKIW